MANRDATVEIASFGPGTIAVRLSGAEIFEDDMLRYVVLNIDPNLLPPLDSRANVVAYGTALTQALCSHDSVKAELRQIFGTTLPNLANLRFAIGAAEAEVLRWETLCQEENHFLALNGTCTLRRIALGNAAQSAGLRTFVNPVRMAAFLSPCGITSAGEFGVIAQAIDASRKNGLELEADIYLGEQDLLDQAIKDADAGQLHGIRLHPIPDTAVAVGEAIIKARPQLLHFFCHGHADAGEQLLEMASISDHDTESPTGSIQLSIQRLKQVLLTSGTIWATVLNSCSGARQVRRLYSMAASLAKSASPIVIGMAEPIDHGDATRFARVFYQTAFSVIQQAIGGLEPGYSSVIDLGPAVGRARDELHETYKAGPSDAFGRWCLPILYQRDEPLRVARTAAEMQTRIGIVAQALRSLPVTAPAALRVQILTVLDAEPRVPEALRPDRFGNLA